jgi:hypothetical protein
VSEEVGGDVGNTPTSRGERFHVVTVCVAVALGFGPWSGSYQFSQAEPAATVNVTGLGLTGHRLILPVGMHHVAVGKLRLIGDDTSQHPLKVDGSIEVVIIAVTDIVTGREFAAVFFAAIAPVSRIRWEPVKLEARVLKTADLVFDHEASRPIMHHDALPVLMGLGDEASKGEENLLRALVASNNHRNFRVTGDG